VYLLIVYFIVGLRPNHHMSPILGLGRLGGHTLRTLFSRRGGFKCVATLRRLRNRG